MILVTGGTGLVGSQLLFDLTIREQKVRALKRKNSDLRITRRLFNDQPERFNRIEWVEGDVTDLFSIEDALQGVDTVYHSAAMISFLPEDKEKMYKINVEGTANMVNMALEKKVKNFCHVSSVAALGRSEGNRTIDEHNLWKTSKFNSNYAISKYGGEREVWRGVEEGLNAVIINPSIIIGPGNWITGSTQLFPSIYHGLPFYSAGITGYVDVRDVSRCAIELVQKNIRGERFIISAENLSYKDLFFMIADEMQKKRPFIEAKPWMSALVWRIESFLRLFWKGKSMITKETARSAVEKWYYNNEKICKTLNTEFIPIRSAVQYTVNCFLEEKTTSGR